MHNKRTLLLKMIIKTLEDGGMVFGNDPHTLSSSQSNELYEWSVAAHYRISPSSPLSPGRQFYQSLSSLKQVE
jgi:hypothetical protein